MDSLLLVLCLLSADDANAAHPGFAVMVEATPWKQLLVDPKPKKWVVVAVPSGDPALDAVAPILQRDLVESMASNQRVRTVREAPPNPAYASRLDGEIAADLAAAHKATRILVVRLYPAGSEGAAPKVLFNVLDEDGESVASATAMSVVVWQQGKVSKGVERIFRESDAEHGEESDDDDDNSDRGRAGNSEARDAFVKAALVAREVDDEATQKSTWVILRGGRELTPEELDELNAPDLTAPEASWFARRWPLVVFGSLEGVAASMPLACAALGILSGMGFCAGLYAAAAISAGQNAGAILGNAWLGMEWGCTGCVVTGPGGLLLGAVAGAVTAVVGIAGMVWAPRAKDGGNAVLTYVTEHNTALARKLGLKVRKLPRKYFPAR